MVTKLKRNLTAQAGFTLIELMLVVAVLGILAGIAVPRITGVREEAIRGVLEANGTTIRNAMERENSISGKYPDLSDVSDFSGLNDALPHTDLSMDTSDISFDSAETTDVDGDGNTEEYEIVLNGADGTITADITPSGVSLSTSSSEE